MTFKKILFPTDFSANADRALEHAVHLADPADAELIVQHVVSDYFERHSHWATLFDIHELQKRMDGYVVSRVLPAFAKNPAVRVRQVISKGKPAEEISALAEKELVDVVVMGSAKGVVTNDVIRRTLRPVFATSMKGGSHPLEVKRILVATDFSEHSKKVVRYAFDLKKAFNATLYLLYVVETPRALEFGVRQGAFFQTIEKMRKWANDQLVNLTPDEYVNDATVIRIVDEGGASDRIADVAGELGADLTIVGTHGYEGLRRHFLGGTTDDLLTKIDSPLLAVKL